MKKILYSVLIALLLATNAYSQPTGGPSRVYTSSECNVAAYYPIGVICGDTDDGKYYIGTGAAVAALSNADLAAILAGGTANCIWGEKSDGTGIECKTTLSVSAIAMTGTIQGGVLVSSDADGMTAADMTTVGLYGTLFIATGNGTWILPTALQGMSMCLKDSGGAAHDLILDVQSTDDISLDGETEDTNGDGITNASGSTKGDFVCVVAISNGHWVTVGTKGTWVAQ